MDLLTVINKILGEDLVKCFPKNCLNFHKLSRSHGSGDYLCTPPVAVNNDIEFANALNVYLRNQQEYLAQYLKFSIDTGRIFVKLDRTYFFRVGIRDCLDADRQYGFNKILKEQQFIIVADSSGDLFSITHQRKLTVVNVLKNLIEISGGEISENNYIKKIAVSTRQKLENADIILVGPILNSEKYSDINFDQYKTMRTKEITQMHENKLESQSTNLNIEDLVDASITFDLIGTSIWRAHALLDNSCKLKTSCKGSLFVLYNFARLSTLLNKMEFGEYPKLPAMEEIDFSLLTQDDEWVLLFDFVLLWPLIVKNLTEEIYSNRVKFHSIINYLVSLSSHFSAYYHRTKILTEPRYHLLPMLNARIYLLKALHILLKNVFELLSINAPASM